MRGPPASLLSPEGHRPRDKEKPCGPLLVCSRLPLPIAERRAILGTGASSRTPGTPRGSGWRYRPPSTFPDPCKCYYGRNVPTLTRRDEPRAAISSAPSLDESESALTSPDRGHSEQGREEVAKFRPSPSISPEARVPPRAIPPLFSSPSFSSGHDSLLGYFLSFSWCQPGSFPLSPASPTLSPFCLHPPIPTL